jgi:hypothetical protein
MVETAIAHLLDQGRPITVAAIRAQIGTGSASVIQRHLDAWDQRRAASRPRSPFSVSADDVGTLDSRDFAGLINHLIRCEIRANNIATAPETTMRVNNKDGGIDGRVSWSGEPKRTARLPAPLTVWQSKSGRLLSKAEFLREIERRDGTDLKPRLREALEAGGAYVIFCAADMTAEQKDIRESALTQSVRRFLPGAEPKISIVAGNEIAEWASEDLWSLTFLIRANGREHPARLLTFEEWAQQPELVNEYIWSDDTRHIAEAIREKVERGALYRLDGSPGLGKTRLALEALRPLTQSGVGVTYFNARGAGSAHDLLNALPAWKRRNVSGILVVDDCDAALHDQIASAVATSGLAAVTIDYRHEMRADETLRSSADTIIDQIVRSHPLFRSDPQEQGSRAAAIVARIVKYAEGWPLMAIMVLRHVVNGMNDIADLDDDQLTHRLIDDPREPDGPTVLRVLSLFDHVGFRDDFEDEWETIREVLTPNIPHDKFYKIARSYEKRDLVVAIGRYWRVTPPPLAIRLVSEWLHDTPPDTQDKLFNELPAKLIESLADRLRHTSTNAAISLARQLLAPAGRFGTLAGILGRSNARIFRALAEIEPEAALSSLTRNLADLPDDELVAINEHLGRQYLVWALEGIAFHGKHFKGAARLLFDLARNENATNSNNSKGTFKKLFNLQGSQTEAPPVDRVEIIREALLRDDEASLEVIAKAISAMLSSQPSSIILGVEWQGGRPELKEWKPQTWGDIFEYESAAVDSALLLATKGSRGFELGKHVVAEGIILLARHKRWDDLRRALEPFKGEAWPKAIENLTWLLQHGIEPTNAEARSEVTSLIEFLSPSSLHERIKLFVTAPPHNLQERGSVIADVSIEQAAEFAAETAASGQVDEVLKVISSGSHRLAYSYAAAVAENSANLVALVETALKAYSTANELQNDGALAGIMSVIARREPELRARVLDQIASDDRLANALPLLSTHPYTTASDIERLMATIGNGTLPKSPRRFIFGGKVLATIAPSMIRQFASLLIDRGWYGSAADVLLFGIENKDEYDDLFARIILESDLIRVKMPDLHDWSMFEIAKRIINGGDLSFSIAIVNQMIDLAMLDLEYSDRHRVSELWPTLLSQPQIWEIFRERYAAANEQQRWNLLYALYYLPPGTAEHSLALDVVPLKEIIAFASENPEDVPAFIARHGRVVDEDRGGALTPTPLLLAILQAFGSARPVLQAVSANLRSFASVGPRAGYYANRVQLIEKIPSFAIPSIAAWKETLRSTFESEKRRAETQDRELEEGLF